MPEDETKTDKLAEAVASFIENKAKGDSMKGVEMLLKENFEAREKNRTLRSELDELKGKQLKENQVVISADEKKLLDDFLVYGRPDEIKKLKSDLDEANGKIKSMNFDFTLSKAAKDCNYNERILKDLIRSQNVDVVFEDVEETQDGKTIKLNKPFVVLDDKGTKKDLQGFVKEKFSDYLPSLEVKSNGGSHTTWVTQQGGSMAANQNRTENPAQSVLSKYAEKKKEN